MAARAPQRSPAPGWRSSWLRRASSPPASWLSIRCTVARELSEDDPDDGPRVTAQLDKIWTKYTGNTPPYGLRDPSIDERRVLFELARREGTVYDISRFDPARFDAPLTTVTHPESVALEGEPS